MTKLGEILALAAWIELCVAAGVTADGAEGSLLVVAADGSGTYRTIQSAVEAAEDGSVIEVRPGRYVGPVRIEKRVEVRGVGWEEVTLTSEMAGEMKEIDARMRERFGGGGAVGRGPKPDAAEVEEVLGEFGFPLLKVKGSDGVVISGLKLVHGMKGDKNRLMGMSLVDFDGTKVTMRDCAVLGGPGNGIAVRNGSTVTVTNCLVAAQWGTGIAIGGRDDLVTRAEIVDSEIRNCYHRCVTIRSEREVRVERCRISGSAWHGIRYDDCSPVVEGCLIAEHARSGIYASGKTAATVRNNVFWRNAMGGISAWFANRDVIEGNTFVENTGVSIIARTAPTIRRNLLERSGVAITQSRTEGVGEDEVLGLEEIEIEGNVFVENEGIWRGMADEKAGIKRVKGSVLEGKGNKDGTVGVVEAGKDFRLSEEFLKAYPNVGSRASFAKESKWPLQPEEKAIIPEDPTTRDWRQWKL